MCKFLRKLFRINSTEERKVKVTAQVTDVEPIKLSPEEVNQLLLTKLIMAKQAGCFNKEYKLIETFIRNNYKDKFQDRRINLMTVHNSCITPEVKSFAKQFEIRGIKCHCGELVDFMSKVNSI